MNYLGEKISPCSNITRTKMLWNSVVSTDKARFMTLDIKDYFLQSNLPDPEYIRIHKNIFSVILKTNIILKQS